MTSTLFKEIKPFEALHKHVIGSDYRLLVWIDCNPIMITNCRTTAHGLYQHPSLSERQATGFTRDPDLKARTQTEGQREICRSGEKQTAMDFFSFFPLVPSPRKKGKLLQRIHARACVYVFLFKKRLILLLGLHRPYRNRGISPRTSGNSPGCNSDAFQVLP